MEKSRYSNELIIAARGVENVYNRTDVLMLAYADILRFMDETMSDMVEDGQDTRGLYNTTTELHTLRDLLMREFDDLQDAKDKLLKIIEPK